MESKVIKLGEALQLESEINGQINPQSGEIIYEGFMKQNLSIILKYDLKELCEFLENEKKKVESIRNDLIKKYGENDDEGNFIVKMLEEVKDEKGTIVSKKISENYLKFDQEYTELLEKDITITYPIIKKEDLIRAGDTKDDYKILFKLIKKEEVK